MTLLIAVFAAVACTVIWYKNAPGDAFRLSTLCFMYWGAALMWLVDAVLEYAALGAAYFTPDSTKMLNDAFLGLAVVALGLVVWLILLLIKDPSGVMRAVLLREPHKK